MKVKKYLFNKEQLLLLVIMILLYWFGLDVSPYLVYEINYWINSIVVYIKFAKLKLYKNKK